jgi:hypothetical protein
MAHNRGLLREAVTGRYQPHGDVAAADCVVGFAFGVRGRKRPGVSNEQLAALIIERWPGLPRILQGEIAGALRDDGVPRFSIDRHRQHGHYLDTREVAEQALELMSEHGLSRPLIVAQAHHVPRADAVCRLLGMKTIVPPGLSDVFDGRSAQRWTQNQPAWGVRETVAIAYYELRGWV